MSHQVIDRELSSVQAGFRKGRGTREKIANIWWTWERAKEYNEKIFLCFIDYKKALDCVDHSLLRKTLREIDIADQIASLLHNLYDGQTATVQTYCRDIDQLAKGKGVRQGCIMSPTLLIIIIYLFNRIMSNAQCTNVNNFKRVKQTHDDKHNTKHDGS